MANLKSEWVRDEQEAQNEAPTFFSRPARRLKVHVACRPPRPGLLAPNAPCRLRD